MGFAISDMQLTSTAFTDGERIPTRHTGESDDLSPPLAWTGPPEGTQAYALICHDPDAPLIKPGACGYVQGVSAYTGGVNDFGTTRYGGPMPPEGHGTHRYFFCLFASSRPAALPEGLSLWQLLEAIEPDVLGMNRLMGTYSR